MAIKLYWGSGSPFAWRVMLTLEVKGLAYESKLLEFSKGEHKAADYLRLNPRGKVPTLQDDDFVLYESLAIMTYLDRHYPEPPILMLLPLDRTYPHIASWIQRIEALPGYERTYPPHWRTP